MIVLICLFILVFSAVLFAQKKTKKAAVQKASASEKTVQKYYTKGVSYHKAGDYKNAIASYNTALKADRRYWQAWLGLGICYYNTKKYSNARLIFKYVLTIRPNEPTSTKYYNMMSGITDKEIRGKKKEQMLKGDMMWRSALLPGLGQFYNDELAKGYIYTFSYIGSIAAIIKYTIDQQAAVDAYKNATADFDAKYKTADEAAARVFIPVGAAALILVVSVVDAFMSGADTPEQRRSAELFMPDEYTVAVNLATYRF